MVTYKRYLVQVETRGMDGWSRERRGEEGFLSYGFWLSPAFFSLSVDLGVMERENKVCFLEVEGDVDVGVGGMSHA
jgi:hypothetical protein